MEWSGEPKMSGSSGTPGAIPTRELAAIMFSDIAGYTAIMGRDERKALRALDDHRDLLRTILPRFNGRLVGEIGDGTLSSFHSALDAVNCARAAQAALQDDPSLKLRIGIHVGDGEVSKTCACVSGCERRDSAGRPLDSGSSAGQLLGRSKPGIFR